MNNPQVQVLVLVFDAGQVVALDAILAAISTESILLGIEDTDPARAAEALRSWWERKLKKETGIQEAT